MFKLTVLYGHPTDPEEFERYHHEIHLPLVNEIEGMARMEHGRFLSNADGSEPDFYRIFEAWFDSPEELHDVFASPAGEATWADLPNFATGGVTLQISEVE